MFIIYTKGVKSLYVSFCPGAYDALDPNGNITIKWDIISWTPDGYVVSIISLRTFDNGK